ncbi:MAG: SGNH/GDSL hydrolase family protein [Kiritimatiellales bacterium]|nr:SGNH/GDSL hydrolase family protein [Kiritimatiellales bacterium]
MKCVWIIVLAGMMALNVSAKKQKVEPGSFEEKAGKYSWEVKADPNLPNMLILGDSISIGYTLQVRQFLKGKANVYRPLSGAGPENCGDSVKAVDSIDKWLSSAPKWDVIHFNSGLHDLKRIDGKNTGPEIPSQVSIADYKKNLQTVVDKMKATGAKLIFATTTAYPAGVKPCRLPEDAVKYNNAAAEVMRKNQVQVNDLYAFTVNRLEELQNPLNVHFSEEGSTVLGKEIAETVATAMGWGKITCPAYTSFAAAAEAGNAFIRAKEYKKAIGAFEVAAELSKTVQQSSLALKKLEQCRANLK